MMNIKHEERATLTEVGETQCGIPSAVLLLSR